MPMSLWLALAISLATEGAAAAPVPIPDVLELAQCEERMIMPLLNDTESSPEAMPLRVLTVLNANLGTAEVLGTDIIRYKAGEKPGSERLTYIVANARGENMQGEILVTIKEGGSCS